MNKNTHSVTTNPDNISYTGLLASATGMLSYRLTNDYLFHAVLQKNNRVLRALLCSLLRLKSEDISSVQITNPIELGQSIHAKNFILDIRILMNNNTLINLEMQDYVVLCSNYLPWDILNVFSVYYRTFDTKDMFENICREFNVAYEKLL